MKFMIHFAFLQETIGKIKKISHHNTRELLRRNLQSSLKTAVKKNSIKQIMQREHKKTLDFLINLAYKS